MNTPVTRLVVSERYRAGKARLLRLLSGLATSGLCRNTVYLTSESLRSPEALGAIVSDSGLRQEVSGVIEQVGEPETGLALFLCDDRILAVVPPFPMNEDLFSEGVHTAPLIDLLRQRPLVGVLLLRLGRYAVGVVQGDDLLASKSGSRYVKSRHRAGGSSQHRFERSRERLTRELFDKACQVANDLFARFGDRIDYLMMGGEHHTLQGFVRRCYAKQGPAYVLLQRRLDVVRPGLKALQQMPHEVWKSGVIVLSRGEESD